MLRRLGVQTAGESHGRGIVTTLTGVPAGLRLDRDAIDRMLALRQAGFGRSARQKLETDRADVLSGVVRGRTTGAPLVLVVWNVDDSLPDKPAFHRPRPGHADLAGGQKYDATDMRPMLERASARETAGRVAAGAVLAQLLQELGVEVLGHVLAVGEARAAAPSRRAGLPGLRRRRDRSPFHTLDKAAEGPMEAAVLAARAAGDTLGGIVEVQARGVPAGLGSLEGFGSRLDARIGAAILSIQAFKAVEIGDGVAAGTALGSQVHDPVGRPGAAGPTRPSNRAGGLEGGMTNGQPVIVRGWMKPIATLRQPLPSWDYAAGKASEAHFERSDVTAVPAAAIVAEAMLAIVLSDALLEHTGGDTLAQVRQRVGRRRAAVAGRFGASSKGRRRGSGPG